MCIKLDKIINDSDGPIKDNKHLISYILDNCSCEYCRKIDSQVQAIILIRNLAREKLNMENSISRRLKSISDKEVDYRIKKWMDVIYNQTTDYQSIMEFISKV